MQSTSQTPIFMDGAIVLDPEIIGGLDPKELFKCNCPPVIPYCYSWKGCAGCCEAYVRVKDWLDKIPKDSQPPKPFP